ncbi:putative immunity protein [Williamsia phyllosphaerae]|uniref:Imm-5-like domain-containing protein n=1 Tax=Williamsia phyllosphaerae TaxID=885042 RepID=A0ABQ1UZD4_9NOCA|nr:exonuclease SbcC [Williamsia phyllosphaerae]GGF31631.1 hypothetical protein GCM10007298_29310 [Williamsia phyllosphaerae]
MTDSIALTTEELRAVTRFATNCAREVLAVFENDHPLDGRPRAAIRSAQDFVDGGRRTRFMRISAFAANTAATEATTTAAAHAARSAGHAAAAAYLHPLTNGHQVKHILGSAGHAARAAELAYPGLFDATRNLRTATEQATSTVVSVLKRYPPAPSGGGRVGELVRELDSALRARSL